MGEERVLRVIKFAAHCGLSRVVEVVMARES
jgi:hypothetical protein